MYNNSFQGATYASAEFKHYILELSIYKRKIKYEKNYISAVYYHIVELYDK